MEKRDLRFYFRVNQGHSIKKRFSGSTSAGTSRTSTSAGTWFGFLGLYGGMDLMKITDGMNYAVRVRCSTHTIQSDLEWRLLDWYKCGALYGHTSLGPISRSLI